MTEKAKGVSLTELSIREHGRDFPRALAADGGLVYEIRARKLGI